MGKWYDNGFNDGQRGITPDPPYAPGNKHHDDYNAGWADGVAQEAIQQDLAEGAYDDPMDDFNYVGSRHHY